MRKQRTVTVDQPAAGADWSFVPSTSDWSKLVSITAKLVTSATAANRGPDLHVTDLNGNVVSADAASIDQIASSTFIWSWRPGAMFYGQASTSGVVANSCPGFWLPPGAAVGTKTVNIDAADQWSLVVATFIVGGEWEHLELVRALESVASAG